MINLAKKKAKGLSWAELPQTIDEVGSTFTVQGFDLNYVGVIIGPSVGFENGEIVYRTENSFNRNATQKLSVSSGQKLELGETLIKNELNVLLTRGARGLYVYACDENLRKALQESIVHR